MFGFLRRFFAHDIAMDLGTANTLLSSAREDMLVNEPSVVALDADSGAVLAVGAQAKAYLGRTPRKIRAVRPMKDGVIADFDVTREMIAYFVGKAIGRSRLFRPSMVISIPSGITQVEKKAVIDAALLAGAGDVRLIEEPMAAALGAGLPVQEAVASMVLDIGGGTSEVAVISLSAMSVTQSLRIAGDAMNDAVRRYMRDVFGIVIGENSAERLKMELGTAVPVDDGRTADVMGKDVVLGTPKTVTVSEAHVREALSDSLQAIAGAVLRALEMTPPELAADIYERGMLLAGGGGLLRGLDQYLAAAARIRVTVDDDPLTTVLRGSATAMRDKTTYEDLFIN
ncbi:rod shape-determining protein [Desulfovibrio sp.]|uniref:rod shape-determining protein n=1 Tax=Desulfovibrio sp. TaxID=885 RepID=UPI0025C6D8A6|nr:rod shape-determining protein [Desulfovibrio sp.]MCI7568022.1 rod shape-determining protein [Desulfovibrio sp.]